MFLTGFTLAHCTFLPAANAHAHRTLHPLRDNYPCRVFVEYPFRFRSHEQQSKHGNFIL